MRSRTLSLTSPGFWNTSDGVEPTATVSKTTADREIGLGDGGGHARDERLPCRLNDVGERDGRALDADGLKATEALRGAGADRGDGIDLERAPNWPTFTCAGMSVEILSFTAAASAAEVARVVQVERDRRGRGLRGTASESERSRRGKQPCLRHAPGTGYEVARGRILRGTVGQGAAPDQVPRATPYRGGRRAAKRRAPPPAVVNEGRSINSSAQRAETELVARGELDRDGVAATSGQARHEAVQARHSS